MALCYVIYPAPFTDSCHATTRQSGKNLVLYLPSLTEGTAKIWCPG